MAQDVDDLDGDDGNSGAEKPAGGSLVGKLVVVVNLLLTGFLAFKVMNPPPPPVFVPSSAEEGAQLVCADLDGEQGQQFDVVLGRTNRFARKNGHDPVNKRELALVALHGLDAVEPADLISQRNELTEHFAEGTEAGTNGPVHEPEQPFIVNLNEAKGSRYLKSRLAFELADAAALQSFEQAKRAIRDDLLRYLSSLSVADTMGEAAKGKIRQEIKRRINTALGAGRVTRVFLVEFVVQ